MPAWIVLVAAILICVLIRLMSKHDEQELHDAVEDFFRQVAVERNRQIASGPEKECPECLTVVSSKAKVCRACRYSF